MNPALNTLTLSNVRLKSGHLIESIQLTYQIFGAELHTAPLVLVHHALTGNSNVADEKNGWWKELIGKNKGIDTSKYTVLAFNIPGNGFDGHFETDVKKWSTSDVADLYLKALELLNITNLYANLGGSLGGGIVWEMSVKSPRLSQYIIPVATDWKSTDWLIAQCFIQEQLLQFPQEQMGIARQMAMMFYRTPESFESKFHRQKQASNLDLFQVESWLNHHANRIQERFDVKAYRMMNQFLKTIQSATDVVDFESKIQTIQGQVIQIGISSDWLFTAKENKKTQSILEKANIKNDYFEIQSPHGHDAFLIEYEQLTEFIKPIFK